MEDTKTYPALKEDRQMLLLMHLSQLLFMVTAVGGIIVPLILWQLKKDEVQYMDEQGKEVVNFQISLFIYYAVSTALIFLLVGIPLLIAVGLINIIFPIIYGIQANNGVGVIRYPLTIRFIK
ncbi:MAG TPA: DUF4870 domain-containing protein [Flavobacteriaceae bacterium]|nr:DUF4870 domain-containing protein [Flavobacteriaceae bacterium]